MANLREFSYEVNLRSIIREDGVVEFEAWAWVPKSKAIADAVTAVRRTELSYTPTVNDWVRVSRRASSLTQALGLFNQAARDFCSTFWNEEQEPAEKPKRKIRRR